MAVAIGWPLGVFLSRVWNGEKTFLDPVVRPVEGLFYKACGVDPTKSQSWRAYAAALLAFNLIGFIFVYAVLRLQGVLPLNPQGFPGLSGHLAFDTAFSFVTNTNWQGISCYRDFCGAGSTAYDRKIIATDPRIGPMAMVQTRKRTSVRAASRAATTTTTPRARVSFPLAQNKAKAKPSRPAPERLAASLKAAHLATPSPPFPSPTRKAAKASKTGSVAGKNRKTKPPRA